MNASKDFELQAGRRSRKVLSCRWVRGRNLKVLSCRTAWEFYVAACGGGRGGGLRDFELQAG